MVSGPLTITGSTISGNTARQGAGLYLVEGASTSTISNSTIAGNTATGGGGGIAVAGAGTLNLANDTIVGNTSRGGAGGGIALLTGGGGLTTNLLNTIVANNTDATNQAPDISGTVVAAFSLVRSKKGATFVGYTGSDVFGVDPHLGPLQNNGGPTMTMALLANSVAIDAGYDGVAGPPYSLTTDQRGRPAQGRPPRRYGRVRVCAPAAPAGPAAPAAPAGPAAARAHLLATSVRPRRDRMPVITPPEALGERPAGADAGGAAARQARAIRGRRLRTGASSVMREVRCRASVAGEAWAGQRAAEHGGPSCGRTLNVLPLTPCHARGWNFVVTGHENQPPAWVGFSGTVSRKIAGAMEGRNSSRHRLLATHAPGSGRPLALTP